MTTIPGAEYAPILTRTVRDLGPEGSDFSLWREIRWHADVNDPDDQSTIWRLAALALGAAEEEARCAVLVRYDSGWALGVLGRPRHRTRFCLLLRLLRGADLAHATAALCAAIWGPR